MSGHAVAAIWRDPLPDWKPRLAACIRDAVAARTATTRVFFRADDVGVPGERFREMVRIFMRYDIPLNLAVVPAWLTAERWRALVRIGREAPHLWCWHQHGWRHVNHEIDGKKQEFGASRSRLDIKRDIVKGKRRLEDLMEAEFFPVFTPPWNRCSLSTLQLLQDLGYAAVSRSSGSRPKVTGELTDFFVNVDLHTRKERDPTLGWHNLFNELQQAIPSDRCGIMIHHQRMNEAAFAFLEYLLKVLSRSNGCRFASMKEWVRD